MRKEILGATVLRKKRWPLMTLEEFAASIGESVYMTRRYEKCEVEPGLILAMQIAAVLGLTMEDLFEWAEEVKQRRVIKRVRKTGRVFRHVRP